MQKSYFFNSAPGDPRTYQASDFAAYFGNVLSPGLLHTNNVPAMQVKCEGTDLRTYVEPGKAIIQGYAYENTANEYLTHAIPEATLDRIDRIILRLDKRNQSRHILLFVKQGEAAENPVPPTLQRDEFIYELSLAQIRVRANTSTLNPIDLIDERLSEELCGTVSSLISVPTNVFEQQWKGWLGQRLDSFEEWFDQLKNVLDGDVAGNLYNEIGKAETRAKDYTDSAPEPMLQNMGRFEEHKTNKDEKGTFWIVEEKREDGTLFEKSEFSAPNADGNPTVRTVTTYSADGTTIVGTVIFDIYYDEDGDYVRGVPRRGNN
ncbi:hypothetical protein ACH0BF_20470 [Pseudobacillus sp. 179-B 2D1 NHS]|uniref:hypothetical protein n=1 Tax=Pseudobacillus sp. 179-B 2D1 NHS TaxID=3374292 RepID=UPI00387A628A